MCIAWSTWYYLPEYMYMCLFLMLLLIFFCSNFLLDQIEKLLLIFQAVFQLILCQSQSLLQNWNSLQKRRTKSSVPGDLVVRMMVIISSLIFFKTVMPTLLPRGWLRNELQNLLRFCTPPQGKARPGRLRKGEKEEAFKEKGVNDQASVDNSKVWSSKASMPEKRPHEAC